MLRKENNTAYFVDRVRALILRIEGAYCNEYKCEKMLIYAVSIEKKHPEVL